MKIILIAILCLFLCACGAAEVRDGGVVDDGDVLDGDNIIEDNADNADDADIPPEDNETPALPVIGEPYGALDDPKLIYFYDTYGQLADNPTIMWGDLNWQGWHSVMQPMTDEGGGWYSFELPAGELIYNYNMVIFFNGLPDDDPDVIQWVWNFNRSEPQGNFFIADKAEPVNPPDVIFAGEQRDAPSFPTYEAARAALERVAAE